MTVPSNIKLYHICHVDRLSSIIRNGGLFSDAIVQGRSLGGTIVGMSHIKERRLTELELASHPGLFVGQCVPFYFCPRSVMLYLIWRQSSELVFKGGQSPVVHLEADLQETVDWAIANNQRWAFTLSNAGSRYFEDRADLNRLHEVNWSAVYSSDWRQCIEAKQSEFLIEDNFPWHLVRRIGVLNQLTYRQVVNLLPEDGHRPMVEVRPGWYYP